MPMPQRLIALLTALLTALLIVALTACGGAPPPATPTPTAEATPPDANVTPEVTPEPPPLQVLAWINAAPADSATGGQVALLDSSGTVTPVLDVGVDERVIACGDAANRAALFVGGETGSLYLMDGTRLSAPIASTYYLACFDGGTFQFSPDGSRFGYMDYNPSAFTREYADGVLHLYDAATMGEIASFDDVIAYTLLNDRAGYVRLYQNARGEGAEAAIHLWDGVSNRELLTLTPTGADCRFTSAAISLRGELGAVALGQRCANQGTDWQLYLIDVQGRAATLAASGDAGGAYFAYARTNQVWLSPNGAYAVLTVPDGVTARTAGLVAVSVSDFSVTRPIERQILLPHHEDVRPVSPRSPDGAWLAFPLTSPGANRNGLAALELDNPLLPLRLEIGLNSIGGIGFTDTEAIYAERNPGGAGALAALDLATGAPRRITRGAFADGLAISPDGERSAAHLLTGVAPFAGDLVAVTLADGALSTLHTGAPETRAYPLAWLR